MLIWYIAFIIFQWSYINLLYTNSSGIILINIKDIKRNDSMAYFSKFEFEFSISN